MPTSHDDYLDPTLHDDTTARFEPEVWCDRCGDQITGVIGCGRSDVDLDRPKCEGCCDCPDCASDACSAQHTPGTGTWYAA